MSDKARVESMSPSLAGGDGVAGGGPRGVRSKLHARPGNLPKNRIVPRTTPRHTGSSSASLATRSFITSPSPDDPIVRSESHVLAERTEFEALEDTEGIRGRDRRTTILS